METFLVLFWDSFNSMFVLSLSSETAWFAARDFGTHDLLTTTCICILGSMFGALATMSIGYIIGYNKHRIKDMDTDLSERLSVNFARYGIFIFLFQMIPFSKLFLFMAGVFTIPWRKLVLFVFAGRILYYIYYLSLDKLIFG